MQQISPVIAESDHPDRIYFRKELWEKISNPSAFALQKGALLEAQRLYREAIFAYLPLIADTTRDAANAERKLLALLNFASSSEQAESTLLESITDSNNLLI